MMEYSHEKDDVAYDKAYHIISYHIISYYIISYHVISYHTISHHIRLLCYVGEGGGRKCGMEKGT